MKTGLLSFALTMMLGFPVLVSAAAEQTAADTIPSSVARTREHFEQIEKPVTIIEQIGGFFFDWKLEFGGEPDIDCFPVGNLIDTAPELIDWEVPGEVIRGIRKDRLLAVIVEATKEIAGQVENCFRLLQKLAEQLPVIQNTISGHSSQLSSHETSLTDHGTSISTLQERTLVLEETNRLLQQQVQQLAQAVQQLQQSACTCSSAAGQ